MSEQTPSYVTTTASRPEQLEVLGYVQDTYIPSGDRENVIKLNIGAYLAQGKESTPTFGLMPLFIRIR